MCRHLFQNMEWEAKLSHFFFLWNKFDTATKTI